MASLASTTDFREGASTITMRAALATLAILCLVFPVTARPQGTDTFYANVEIES